MALEDKHILYPDHLVPPDVVARIQAVLNRAKANKAIWLDEKMDWENFIFRTCFEWGINPAWVLVSLQRERSLFGQEGDERDFDFAQGFVGQDAPGTANTRWNGLPTQIFLAARGAGWLSGRGEGFGWRPGLRSAGVRRWQEGKENTVQLLGADHQAAKDPKTGKVLPPHVCGSVAEYIQLMYTPHLEVLGVNQSILSQWAPEFL